MRSRATSRRNWLRWVLALAVAGAGCATTEVTPTASTYQGMLPRPQHILVFPFATSPEEVQLDRSPTAVAVWQSKGLSAGTERSDVAHAVSQKLATHLVEKIQAMGLPAEVVWGPLPERVGATLLIDGQFISIDEGNRAERVVIGLGAGRSSVRTAVQVSEQLPEGGRRLVDQFDVDAQSSRKPGMAETMGAGAAAGNLAASAAVSGGVTVGTELFGANVDDDAERTASKIASVLQSFFVRQGWIAPTEGWTGE
jgi:Domain of unknown function (DUF4410)